MATTFSQLKLAAAAQPLVERALARASSVTERSRIEAELVRAAGVDGNRVLSAPEVQAVLDAFESVAMGGAVMTPAQLGIGLEKADERLASLKSLSNVDGVETVFTLEGQSVETRLVTELNEAVARANGRPIDLNVLIFEFQSDVIEAAISRLARNNPNATFRVIADSTQASQTGGNALPSLLAERLPNVQVKFKKDFPYAWNQAQGRPDFNHGSTSGLNHHKGLVTFIDGKPDTLLTGSFNWSATADTKNYEDLTLFDNADSASRRAIEQFGDEFAGYWNDPNAALAPNDFQNFKGEQWNAMLVAHGKAPTARVDRPSDTLAAYQVPVDARSADVNGWRKQDEDRLARVLGSKTLATAVLKERKTNGRFASLAELKERVPALANRDEVSLQDLFFGAGTVSINTATAEELDRAGLTKRQADAVVAWRTTHGDYDSLDALADAGVPKATIARLSDVLSPIDVEVFFNSRAFGQSKGSTGYGSGSSRQTVATGADGTRASTAASVTVAATDLFNAAKAGESISVAMYGMSVSAPECKALIDAAKRGAKVRVVLNDEFNEPVVSAMQALAAQGLAVEVRVQKAKTMHEKFGVVGNDVFSGSANFSESSSTKHSENRLLVKNHDEMAAAFNARFDSIWVKSKVP